MQQHSACLGAFTYPLFASMISSFEIQNKLLPHCLISVKEVKRLLKHNIVFSVSK